MTLDEAVKLCSNNKKVLDLDREQLFRWLKQLKEAKEILSLALDDLAWAYQSAWTDEEKSCAFVTSDGCEKCTFNASDEYCGWKHQVRAVLIVNSE